MRKKYGSDVAKNPKIKKSYLKCKVMTKKNLRFLMYFYYFSWFLYGTRSVTGYVFDRIRIPYSR